MFVIIEIGCAECIGWGSPDAEDQLARVVGTGFPNEQAALDSLDLPSEYRDKFYRTADGNLLFSSPSGGVLIANVTTQLTE